MSKPEARVYGYKDGYPHDVVVEAAKAIVAELENHVDEREVERFRRTAHGFLALMATTGAVPKSAVVNFFLEQAGLKMRVGPGTDVFASAEKILKEMWEEGLIREST